jgi:hypothetical protein
MATNRANGKNAKVYAKNKRLNGNPFLFIFFTPSFYDIFYKYIQISCFQTHFNESIPLVIARPGAVSSVPGVITIPPGVVTPGYKHAAPMEPIAVIDSALF